MDLFLDPDRAGTTSHDLFEQLRAAILTGRLAVGDRLPPTRDVAAELGISRSTVTTVYGRLAAEGFIEGRAGAGSFVARVATAPDPSRPAALEPTPRIVAPDVWPAGEPDRSPVRFNCRSGVPDPGLFPTVAWRQCLVSAHQG